MNTNTLLPQLRRNLDIFPSPVADRPGWLIRDPYRYADEILILPPLLAAALECLDGQSTLLDAQAHLSRLAGQFIPGEHLREMLATLRQHGFLETEEFHQLRAHRHEQFAAAPQRVPAHAGTGYADEPGALRLQLDEYLSDFRAPATHPLIGLAAPHVSPWGGWQSYAAAYGRLSGTAKQQAMGKTIVVLGTSHYGQPERFGLTRKPFVTPLGQLQPDLEMIDWLARRAGESVVMEDYCHAIEHSLEFQCVFLQQMLASPTKSPEPLKIVPILCGPFVQALLSGEPPEYNDHVLRFFEALGEMNEMFAGQLFWVLGIDLAHVGRRYGDEFTAIVGQGETIETEEEDRARLAAVCAGESEEFFSLVAPHQDHLKWCGFAPLYTFLQAVPRARGQVLRYDQWNIDEQSVVSFAALEFTAHA